MWRFQNIRFWELRNVVMLGFCGVSRFRLIAIFVFWDLGILGSWDFGILGFWDFGILGFWEGRTHHWPFPVASVAQLLGCGASRRIMGVIHLKTIQYVIFGVLKRFGFGSFCIMIRFWELQNLVMLGF